MVQASDAGDDPSAGTLPSEFALIARYFAPLARRFPGAYGLRDDVAVIAPSPGAELVVKSDAVICGVHVLPDDPPDLVARKALRMNLSDLAAKGAAPRAYLLDLMLPRATTEEWIASFARGLAQDQAEFGVDLIGGDTDATPGPLTVAIMALGEVPAGRVLRRGGACAGDALFVTGTIGDAALGLAALRGAASGLDPASVAWLADRYRLPQPRVALGPRLIGVATAALDVSDGLVADLGHLCEASNLDAIVDGGRIPLSPAARAAIANDPARLTIALTGGDDYEIVFAAPPAACGTIAALAEATRTPVTEIGRLAAPQPGAPPAVTVRDSSGAPYAFSSTGWTHFGRGRG
jgi:thiamine-monophosphate kinase